MKNIMKFHLNMVIWQISVIGFNAKHFVIKYNLVKLSLKMFFPLVYVLHFRPEKMATATIRRVLYQAKISRKSKD